ncbi:MAG: ABC transporter ATP-binding protein [Eubacterium sp.]|nr:ABC transporter ATP-binding protein [Eubacterium sp.]
MQKKEQAVESGVVIDVSHATVQFNMANQSVNNLKEYLIKLARGELMFQEFLALRDMDLQVRAGEAWGIVGPNGAGKSTLLKLICGVIKPYRGSVSVKGSIAPLIELGAGFDGELTAKENVMLNGTLMGYSERFMKKHLDDIIDFADLWDFLDAPMKNYSSGMAARLGFSVATMVQPDILICDEVLAVGDYKFQQKCEERMQHMLRQGTTLLYVSHSNESVLKLCSHALWIEEGRRVMSGEAQKVCAAYLAGNDREIISDV